MLKKIIGTTGTRILNAVFNLIILVIITNYIGSEGLGIIGLILLEHHHRSAFGRPGGRQFAGLLCFARPIPGQLLPPAYGFCFRRRGRLLPCRDGGEVDSTDAVLYHRSGRLFRAHSDTECHRIVHVDPLQLTAWQIADCRLQHHFYTADFHLFIRIPDLHFFTERPHRKCLRRRLVLRLRTGCHPRIFSRFMEKRQTGFQGLDKNYRQKFFSMDW